MGNIDRLLSANCRRTSKTAVGTNRSNENVPQNGHIPDEYIFYENKILMSTLSRTENKVLMSQAREALKEKWGTAISMVVIYGFLVIGFSFIPKGGEVISSILGDVLALGLAGFTLSLSRKQDAKALDIFNERFGVSLGASLLQMLFIILWSLLLIIPGIIAAYSYSLTYYILVDNKDMRIQDAIRKSKEMMHGNKWKLACLEGRFIGWGILCLFTLGIGLLWLFPYMMVSFAKFYDDIKRDAAEATSVQA